jgi:GNAT superfamily N-acetyltransferase
VHIRPADVSDLDAVSDIASIVDPPHDGADFDTTYYQHLLRKGEVVVAEESEIVVGYAGIVEIDGSHHLSDFFLHQDLRGRDIGKRLLDAAWEAAGRPAPRQTLSSLHPAALSLYVRSGMTPRWPLLYLHGRSAVLPPTRLNVASCERDEAASYEAEWLGWDRRDDYSYWWRHPEGEIFSVRDGGTPVAVGCSVHHRGASTLGRLACANPEVAAETVAEAVRWCGDDVLVSVPGVNSAARMLLDAGWRIIEHDLYCASEPNLVDPLRLLPHPGLM